MRNSDRHGPTEARETGPTSFAAIRPRWPRLRWSWSWSLDHSWGIWLDRTHYNCVGDLTFAWRFNVGPLHIVRFL